VRPSPETVPKAGSNLFQIFEKSMLEQPITQPNFLQNAAKINTPLR
jgi:hypothetical protein